MVISIFQVVFMTLSIITINYNNRDGLQKTIDSVLVQTWRDFEWIVIDGGSTDGSRELIEQHQEYFAYWCSEPDKGVYHAMNKGIAKASGTYLLFLNSGDLLYNSMALKKVDEYKPSADIVCCQVIRMDNGQFFRRIRKSLPQQLIYNSLSHQSTFIKRALFNTYRYNENYKIVSDWLGWAEWLLKDNCSIEHLNIILTIQDVTGISCTQLELNTKERIQAFNEVFGYRLAQDITQSYSDLDNLSVRRILFLSSHTKILYKICYYVLAIIVRLYDWFHRSDTFEKYEINKYI